MDLIVVCAWSLGQGTSAVRTVAVRSVRARLLPAATGGGRLCLSRIGSRGCHSQGQGQSQGSKDQGKLWGAHIFSSTFAIWGVVVQMVFFRISYSSSVISPEASRLLRMDRESVLSMFFFCCGIILLMKTAARETISIMNIRCVMPLLHPITLPISQPYISVSFK